MYYRLDTTLGEQVVIVHGDVAKGEDVEDMLEMVRQKYLDDSFCGKSSRREPYPVIRHHSKEKKSSFGRILCPVASSLYSSIIQYKQVTTEWLTTISFSLAWRGFP